MLGRVVSGHQAIVGYVVAVLALSAATVLDRWVTYPTGYVGLADPLLHGGLEVLWGACLASCLFGSIELVSWLGARGLGALPRWTRLVLLALVFGGALYWFVVWPSMLRSLLPLPLWLGALALAAGLSQWLFSLLLRRLTPGRRTTVLGSLVLVTAIALHLVALHRFSRFYGNLHFLVILGATALAALGANLALGSNRAGRLLVLRCGAALIALTMVSPALPLSNHLRRALLQRGAFATRSIEVVWRLTDSDGDGAPQHFWGTDPDDADPTRTPLSPHALVRHRVGAAKPPAAPLGDDRSLLLVLVDTTRRDSFDACLAANPDLEQRLSGFRRFSEYSSCSARTFQVVHRLLAIRTCQSPFTNSLGAGSLIDWMGVHGRVSERIRVIEDFDATPFPRDLLVSSDTDALARARGRLAEATPEKRFFVLHLRGGHAPYTGAGTTPRQRYDSQVCNSIRRVTELLQLPALADWAIALVADHGEEFRDHGALYHGAALYEEMLRTPLLIRAPNIEPGVDAEPLGCADVPAKLAFAAGLLETPPVVNHERFASVDILRGTWGYLRDAGLRSLRVDDWKAIWDPYLDLWELYELRSDPLERRDLASREPAQLARMQARLLRATSACEASWPNLQDRKFSPLN